MDPEYKIDFKNLNELNAKKLQSKLFIITDFTDEEVYDITEIYEGWVCKKIQNLFPNSVLDFVDDEGMYVRPS